MFNWYIFNQKKMELILVTDPLVEKYANLFGTNLWLPFSIQLSELGCKCIFQLNLWARMAV